MMQGIKRLTAGVAATAALAFGAAPAAQAQPVFTGGLVNITVVDAVDLRNVNVQVPIGVAANVCGLSVNALAVIEESGTGPVDCTAATTQDLPVAFQP